MKTSTPAAATKGNASIREVGKVFSRNGRPGVILRDCSFDVLPGKLNVLIGPSGCGKSTLVDVIAG